MIIMFIFHACACLICYNDIKHRWSSVQCPLWVIAWSWGTWYQEDKQAAKSEGRSSQASIHRVQWTDDQSQSAWVQTDLGCWTLSSIISFVVVTAYQSSLCLRSNTSLKEGDVYYLLYYQHMQTDNLCHLTSREGSKYWFLVLPCGVQRASSWLGHARARR